MSTASVVPQPIFIPGVDSALVEQYFKTLNAQDFQATAQLFREQGELHPPLESPVVGKSAIAQYLQKEAVGMKLVPQTGKMHSREQGEIEVNVQGYVETSLFTVKVAWQFFITQDHHLAIVAVKLLASWEELAQIQR